MFDKDDHACVSLKDVLAHQPAHGMDFDNITYNRLNLNGSSISQTPAAQDIYDDVQTLPDLPSNTLILHVIFWSDDFEVTYVKKSPSVWIHTVTISPPNAHATSSRYTHALSIGMKGMDHDGVIRHYLDELQDLKYCNYMYSGKAKAAIPVVVRLLVIEADRPERCTLNCILSHAGTTTPRWRYSALIGPTKLRSCGICLRRRLNRIVLNNNRQISESHQNCHHCADWDYDRTDILGMEPPGLYPNEADVNSPQAPPHCAAGVRKIVPVIQTYESLRQGCAYCFHNVFKRKWNIVMAETYLRILGVKTDYARIHIIDKAINISKTTPNISNFLMKLQYPAL